MGQPPFTDEISITVEKTKILLHTLVGEYLAIGLTNEEVLEKLQTEDKLSEDDAKATLRGVYDSWTSVRVGLNLQAEDDRNWHHFLRMRLLQTAIANEAIPAQNLALRILDSLAALQGITTVQAQPVPLSIELVEKEKKPEPEPKGDKTDG